MSKFPFGRYALGLGALLLLVGSGTTQEKKDDSLLEQVRRREQIHTQALEVEVQQALADVDKAKNKVEGADILRKLLLKLEADRGLKGDALTALHGKVRDKLTRLEGEARSPEDTGPKPSRDYGKPRADEEKRVEQDRLRADLDAIAALRRQGRNSEANRLADDVARRNPTSLEAQQARRTAAVQGSINEGRNIDADRSKSTVAASRDVEKSSTAISGDIVYDPVKWREAQKRAEKYKASLVPMTDKEKEIIKSLSDLTGGPFQVRDMPFNEIIKLLEKELGQSIIISKAAMDEVKIAYETALSLSLPKQITKRTLLRRVLSEVGLTFIIKNEHIEVTSVLAARSELVTRFFPIGDLLGSAGQFGNPNRREAEQLQAEKLIHMMMQQVDPGSWDINGGPGTIVYEAATKMLIVRNTAEVINAMGGGRAR